MQGSCEIPPTDPSKFCLSKRVVEVQQGNSATLVLSWSTAICPVQSSPKFPHFSGWKGNSIYFSSIVNHYFYWPRIFCSSVQGRGGVPMILDGDPAPLPGLVGRVPILSSQTTKMGDPDRPLPRSGRLGPPHQSDRSSCSLYSAPTPPPPAGGIGTGVVILIVPRNVNRRLSCNDIHLNFNVPPISQILWCWWLPVWFWRHTRHSSGLHKMLPWKEHQFIFSWPTVLHTTAKHISVQVNCTCFGSVILRISLANRPMKLIDWSTGGNLGIGMAIDW